MDPVSKWSVGGGGRARNLVVRLLLLGVLVVLVRFAFVVTIHGESCDAGDFCFFSSSSSDPVVPIDAAGISAGGSKAFVRGVDGPAVNPDWTTREWRKAVDFYSSVFQDLAAERILSPSSKALCLGSPAGHEVFALKEIGVTDAVGVAKRKSPPLVVAADPLRQPFGNDTFDFVFVGGGALEGSKLPADLASELARTLKPEGLLVLHTSSAGDPYSLNSLLALFPSCRLVKSREIDGPERSVAVREVVLQKGDGFIQILRPGSGSSGGNSPNKCSIPEHKLPLLKSAEPLIEEEPLKPWITLKRNVKNVKYLPSMADISFKRKYVYVDVGARSYGSSIGSWFKKQYPKQNRSFEVYAIEADKAFYDEYARKKGVTLLPFAAWVRNETLSFDVNHEGGEQKDDGKGRGMGRIQSGPGASVSGNVDIIQGFDFAEWLKSTVSEKDFVVVKMDVEGTEFDLIPRLFETGAICLVDELFLECHYNRWQKCCPGQRSPKYQKTYGQCLELFSSLRESGVLVHQWW